MSEFSVPLSEIVERLGLDKVYVSENYEDTVISSVAFAIRSATYLLFPVALKYRITICILPVFRYLISEDKSRLNGLKVHDASCPSGQEDRYVS